MHATDINICLPPCASARNSWNMQLAGSILTFPGFCTRAWPSSSQITSLKMHYFPLPLIYLYICIYVISLLDNTRFDLSQLLTFSCHFFHEYFSMFLCFLLVDKTICRLSHLYVHFLWALTSPLWWEHDDCLDSIMSNWATIIFSRTLLHGIIS
jgi:hypothetical protein